MAAIQLRFIGARDSNCVCAELGAPVMNPGEAHRIRVDTSMRPDWDTQGLTVSVVMEVDGVRKPLYSHTFTSDELAEAYELVHHEVHGFDPRGLDPRIEKTRLTVNR